MVLLSPIFFLFYIFTDFLVVLEVQRGTWMEIYAPNHNSGFMFFFSVVYCLLHILWNMLIGSQDGCIFSVDCAVLSRLVVSDSLRPHGLQPARLLCPWGFSRQEYWSGLPCPPPWDPPNPGIESRSPALQADSLPLEPPGKPKNTGVGSLSLLQGIFPTQGSNWGVLHIRQILYQLSYQGNPGITLPVIT